jgi:mono/diheme cytochrome c family protein
MTGWRGTVALLLPIVVLAAGANLATQPRMHFANADDGAAAARGAALYAANCAQCHGVHLEGQPGWQVVGLDGVVRPPPQNETGHTWMHSDEELFGYVKYSLANLAAPGYVSPMPAFAGKLSDAEILAVLAFIKSRWPVGVRAYQALLNPDAAGMPAAAAADGWTLPADCGFETNRTPRKPKGSSS